MGGETLQGHNRLGYNRAGPVLLRFGVKDQDKGFAGVNKDRVWLDEARVFQMPAVVGRVSHV